MPIRIFIQDQGGFTHEEAGFLMLSFEYALRKLGSVNRTDTVAIVIAKQIIAIARNGERDPLKLSAKALAALRLRPGDKTQSFNANGDATGLKKPSNVSGSAFLNLGMK